MSRLPRGLLAVSTIVGITWGLLWSVQAPFLRSLGYSGTEYGLLGGLGVVSSAIATILAGVLSDLLGARTVMTIGILVYSLSLILISTGEWLFVLAGYTTLGASYGLYWTSNRALLARITEDKYLHYSLSYYAAAGSLGGAIGSITGWAPVVFSRSYGVDLIEAYRWSIRFLSVFILLCIPLIARVAEGAIEQHKSLLREVKSISRLFLGLAAFEMIIGFGAAMSIHNIDYYFTLKYKVTSGELGSVFALQQLAMALLMIRLPSISDRVGGPLRVYLVVAATSIPLLVGMTLTDSYTIASALYLTRSILMNVATPLFEAFALGLVDRSVRGVASSLLSLSWTIPGSGGRVVGGYLLDIDVELPLRLTAILYTIALAGYAVIGKKARSL